MPWTRGGLYYSGDMGRNVPRRGPATGRRYTGPYSRNAYRAGYAPYRTPLRPRNVGVRSNYYRSMYSGTEYKFIDTPTADNIIIDTGEVLQDSVVEVDQGTGEEQRIGRKITVKKISMRLKIELPTTSNPNSSSDITRIVIVQDRQCNGTALTWTDVFEDANVFSFMNLSNKNRFRILFDKAYATNSSAGSFDGTNDQFGSFYISDQWHKKLNIPIEYSGTGSAIADITSNNIALIACSENAVARFEGNIRVRYTDS